MINLVVVLVAVWAIFVIQLKQLELKLYLKFATYGFISVFFMWNAIACRKHLNARYEGWMNETYNKHFKTLISIEPSFQKWGINQEDKVISIPDFTINTTLYYMNRKGYTDFASDLSKAETFYWRIDLGAKYLVINDSTILSREYLKPFIQNKVGEFKNILVYDIQNIKPDK
jgi:hypothetical protein